MNDAPQMTINDATCPLHEMSGDQEALSFKRFRANE